MSVSPRYNVNANRAATKALSGLIEGENVRLVFAKSDKGTRVQVVPEDTTGSVSFYSRGTNRNGSKLTQKAARAAGIRAKQRYALKKGGKNWFRMIPHSRIGKTPLHTEEPLISVSLTKS